MIKCGTYDFTSEELAWRIRKYAVEMCSRSHASHIGGVLSVADIVAVLYRSIANIDPKDPQNPERDRVFFSKGHNGVAIYAALAELGFFERDRLATYGENGSSLSFHVSHKNNPGIELTTGSLGHGVCVACGSALSGILHQRAYRVFSIIGDGECNEGSVWEMAMLAAHHKLHNLTVIIDKNNMQAMGTTKDIINMDPLYDRWAAFGWNVVDIPDGHDHQALFNGMSQLSEEKPTVIIAHTIKGKGISFMENNILWHYRDPQGDLYRAAIDELDKNKP